MYQEGGHCRALTITKTKDITWVPHGAFMLGDYTSMEAFQNSIFHKRQSACFLGGGMDAHKEKVHTYIYIYIYIFIHIYVCIDR